MSVEPVAAPLESRIPFGPGVQSSALIVRTWAPRILLSAFLLLLAADHGGYFPASWGWAALALCWAGVVGLVLGKGAWPSGLEVGLLAALAALVGWTVLSATWSWSSERPVLEAERGLVYVTGVACVLLFGRRSGVHALLGGLLVAISVVSTWALFTRLFPDRVGVFDVFSQGRLTGPLGYWNALGIFAAIGSLLALGFAARAQRVLSRSIAGAGLVLLLPTMYFTYSRGAWAAFVVGLVVALALDPRRTQLASTALTVGAPAAVGVWLASRSDALTTLTAPSEEAVREGRVLAVALAGLAVLAAALVAVLAAVEARARPSAVAKRVYRTALVGVVAAVLAAVFLRFGSPPTLVERAYDSFTGPVVAVGPGESLNKRYFSLSSNGRLDLWSVARRDFEANRWVGSGAGTFEQYWLEHRRGEFTARDAHSLYVETLAELGVVGLVLLIAVLATPMVGAVRARREALVPAAMGAYAAFVAHAGVDWDWEMAAVTLAGLLCGAILLLAQRGEERLLPPLARNATLVIVACLGVFSFAGYVANSAIRASEEAQEDGRLQEAVDQAHKAIDWAPWSGRAWQQLGAVQLGVGDDASARVSLLEAVEREPLDWSVWYDLGLASTGAEQSSAYREAARLNPLGENVEVLRILGLLPPAQVERR